jgi:hypothetical protein
VPSQLPLLYRIVAKFSSRGFSIVGDFFNRLYVSKIDIGEIVRWLEQKELDKKQYYLKKQKTEFTSKAKNKQSILKKLGSNSKSKVKAKVKVKVVSKKVFKDPVKIAKISVAKAVGKSSSKIISKVAKSIVAHKKGLTKNIEKVKKKDIEKNIGKSLGKKHFVDKVRAKALVSAAGKNA